MKADRRIPTEEPTVEVWITPVIERDHKGRGAFPELRLEYAVKIVNGATGVYRVSMDDANAVWKDAEERYEALGYSLETRGLRHAYTSLMRRVRDAVNRESRRGLWDDPGQDEMSKRMRETPATFRPGETAMLCCDGFDGTEEGELVAIVGAYEPAGKSYGDDGRFVDAKGARHSYGPGYTIQTSDGKQYFARAHQLTDLDYSMRHLRLATKDGLHV